MQHARLSPATAGQGEVTPFPRDTVPMAQRRKQSHTGIVCSRTQQRYTQIKS